MKFARIANLMKAGGEQSMTGRNNKPDNDGPAASPDRLDQFGDKLSRTPGDRPKKQDKNERC
jgi:hypothetical protein